MFERSRALRRQFTRYLAVGALGFAIDGTLLYLLVSQGGNPYGARALSFAVAVTVTWRLHRRWTFETRSTAGAKREYAGYFFVQIVGTLTNYIAYAGVLSLLTPTPANAVIALAAGAGLGLIVNFAGARWFVFKRTLSPHSANQSSG